jgi:hypothetical protein
MSTKESFNEKADIVQLIGEFVELEPTGSHFMGICPNCSECFGCSTRGDAFDFATTVVGFTEEQAMAWLSKDDGNGVSSDNQPRTTGLEIIEGAGNLINPSQDYKSGVGYLGIVLRVTITENGRQRIDNAPHIVTSRKDLIQVRPTTLASRNLILSTEPFPIHKESRWPYALVQKYLKGKVNIVVWRIAERIANIYDQLLDFPVSNTPIVMAIWTIGTYVYRIFEAYPYISLSGDRGSGKTKSLQIAQHLCFNSLMCSDITKASLFRVIEASSATLLIDEVENLKGYKKDENLLKILNAGYKRGNPVVRIDTESYTPQSFDIYSPKILAGIRGLDAVLEDRCIVLHMIKTLDVKKANLTVTNRTESWGEIRNLLYCFALDHFSGIMQGYERVIAEIEPGSVIQGRRGELWFPLLGIARYIDSYGRTSYYGKLKEFAEHSIRDSEQDSLDNWSISLLFALEEMFKKRLQGDYEKKFLTTNLSDVRTAMLAFAEGDTQKLSNKWIGDKLKQMNLGSKKRRKAGFEYTIKFTEFMDRKLRYLPNRGD